MPGRRDAAAPGRALVPAISAVMLARRVAKGSSMGSGPWPPRCRPVPPPSPTAPGAHHSMPPSGAQAVHSTSPSGTKVGICAVARKYCATRCHRAARPSRTRCHRVARSGIADPAPATSHIPRCAPQGLQRRLGQGDRASERRPLTSHERAGQLVASPPAHSWGHPIPVTEWVCVTHVLWRRTHTSMHEVSKGYLK